ncbi:MAG: hypothetical protein GXY67_07710 [Clostridiales bacterium]|nr:hypothetical protein [Clostridiales bacterium]
MICQRCGTYISSQDALTCDHCGALLSSEPSMTPMTGVRAIRQGRMGATPPVLPDQPREGVPEYGDFDMSPLPIAQERSPRRKTAPKGLASFASRPSTHRGVPVNSRARSRPIVARHVKTHSVKKHPVNWMLMGLIVIVILIGIWVGYSLYMSNTDEGQRITARRMVADTTEITLELATSTDDLRRTLREDALKELASAPAHAYWLVGQEYIDRGDVENAILSFRIANILDPENYDGLLLLANAYELNNDDAAAEALYLTLSETVAPSRTEAYTALIRMYQNQSRNPEAAAMMLKAYQNTDRESYRLERKDFIPNTPQVDLPAGRYELEQTVHLTSPQGYDIYYTLDDGAELPKDGIYTEDGIVKIPEGTLTLRAVCISEDLVSDPLSVTYQVFYPTPAAPKTNLAPNTYSSRKTVMLRPGDSKSKETLTFYYTIDGSTPTVESPVFDGTPIQLPTGRVTIRAVAVNEYGKMSSTCEVGYKIDTKPYPLEMYSETDQFDGFVIGVTSPEEFTQRFGAPSATTSAQYLTLTGEAQQMDYPWGSAVFLQTGNKWVLVSVEMNREITQGPRGVGFGSTESEITSVYKDFGQVKAPNGNRGLYYAHPNIGQVLQNADGTVTVQYSCSTLESKIWILQYVLTGDRVSKIVHFYQPQL